MSTILNECILGGTIMEDPQIVGEGEAAWAFMKLMTTFGQKQADGSYIDIEQPIQIVADVPHHVNTVRKYIKSGKAMTVSAYYRTWESGGTLHHGFFIRKLIFASANWTPPQE